MKGRRQGLSSRLAMRAEKRCWKGTARVMNSVCAGAVRKPWRLGGANFLDILSRYFPNTSVIRLPGAVGLRWENGFCAPVAQVDRASAF